MVTSCDTANIVVMDAVAVNVASTVTAAFSFVSQSGNVCFMKLDDRQQEQPDLFLEAVPA